MRMTIYLFYLLFGYLSGSVLYSYLIPKHFCHVDVRTANEDQNPGAFNAFSAAGPRVGLFCVLCDIGKGFLPVFLAVHSSAVSMGSWLFALILLAPVAGHAWPFLQPAKGGKAISVSFGVLLGLLPDLRPALLLAAFYLTAQSALNCFLRRLRCRRSAFPLSAVRTARKSARVTCRLLPPLFQLPTVRIRKCFIYNSVSVC